MSIRRAVTTTLAGAVLVLLCVPLPAWAQGGRVTGTVTNARTGEPVETAQVYIPGTRIGTLTDQDGAFTLIVVPAGEYEVRVEIIGYRTESQVVSVGAGETQVLEFALEPSVLRLQELVVTGTAARMPRAKLPFTVEKLDVEDIPVPATSAEREIQGKGAGIHVVKGSGQPGDAADIMLRAPTTITRGQGPLIIIDGVISWNTMADIDALDIESIEIVKGAAAASLYGSLAANGVVQITTKRGRGLAAGESQVTMRGEAGFQSLEGTFPFRQQHPYRMNAAGTSFVDDAGNDIPYGSGLVLDTIYSPDPALPPPPGTVGYNGDMTSVTFQDKDFPPPTYNHIERFFDPGEFLSFNAAVTGKTGNTNYRASFSNLREKGIILYHNGYKRRNARLNIDHQVWDNFTLSLGGYYAWAYQDEVAGGPMFDLTFMPPNVDLNAKTCVNPAGLEWNDPDCLEWNLVNQPDPMNSEEANPLYSQKNETSEDKNSRILGSLFARWSAMPWLDIEADFGLDRRDFDDWYWRPKGLQQPAVAELTTGRIDRYGSISQNVNASLTAAFHKQFGDVIARGQARYQFEDRHSEWFEAWGSNLGTDDITTLATTDPATRSADSGITDIRSNFVYLVGAADYKGRYILDGLLRWDGSSLFGEDERWNTYYRGSAKWRLAQEPWWFSDAIGEFSLRASYGTAGNRPGFAQQYETYAVSAGAISPVQLGNKLLKPEFAREIEAGLEMVLWNRLNVVVNYSDNKTTDAILNVPLPGYQGFSSQYLNTGTIEGHSWELSLEAALVETQDISWTAKATWDQFRQTITKLGRPPYRSDFFFYKEGEPLGAYWANRWAKTCDELDPVAQASCDEFQLNDDGYLVWVGAGNSWDQGITNRLWGTLGEVGDTLTKVIGYEFGMPIKAYECERRLADGSLVNLPAIECDLDADGTIDLSSDTTVWTSQRLSDFLRIGDTTPDFAWSLSTNFRWKGFTLYVLLDSEIGQDQFFQTGQWAMRENASAWVDQQDKPDTTKKPFKYYQMMYNVNADDDYYLKKGSYMKVRELALGYTFSRDQVRSVFGFMGMQGATLRIVGRNLLTFTDYPGYDPEVSTGGGGSDVIGRTDNYQYPNFRTITATLDLIF